MERYALHFLACRAVASCLLQRSGNFEAAISMTTPLTMCACIFEPFPELSSIAPMERYALHFLACRAVASLSNPTAVANFEGCNIHDNTATFVRLHH